jgi:hypothetical protein
MQRLEVSGAVRDIYIYNVSRLRVKIMCFRPAIIKHGKLLFNIWWSGGKNSETFFVYTLLWCNRKIPDTFILCCAAHKCFCYWYRSTYLKVMTLTALFPCLFFPYLQGKCQSITRKDGTRTALPKLDGKVCVFYVFVVCFVCLCLIV